MRNNFEDIGEKQAYNVKSKKPNALPKLFEGGGRKQLKREKSERTLNSNPVSAAPRKHVIDRIKSQRTTESASKTPELNYREMLKQNVVIGRKDVKQTSLRGDIFKGMLSKSHITDNDPMQSTLNSTTSPNSPSFKIAPVCIGQRSCAGRCTGNMTEFRTDGFSACYCDSACYEIFYDCCADYTKYCDVQKPSNISMKKFKWTCEPLASSGHFRSNQSCVIGEGIWMVSRCPDDWPYDEIRSKCENLTNSLRTISDLSLRCYIPAVSGDLTFRNYFCAKCNYIDEDLEYFSVKIETNVIPPEHYNFSAKINFLLSNGAKLSEDEVASPKGDQKKRYCLKSVVQSCSVGASSESCVNGPVALVSLDGKQFKNYDCALCNEPNGSIKCFPPLCGFTGQLTLRHKFLLKLDYKDTNNEQDSAFTLLRTNCSYGLIYDAKLQDCVEKLPPPSAKEDRVRVLAWFSPSKDSQFSEQDFKTVMKQYFGVENSQLHNVSIETVTSETIPHLSIFYHLVSSILLLTPEQSFDTLFKMNSDSSRLNLRSFIYFGNPLSVTLENITYTIIKTTSRPLSCITHKTYTPQQYLVDKDEQIEIMWTYVVHKKWEYYGQINGNITICEMYSENKCEKIQTGLNKNDFIINTNLSLYQKDTGIQYELGKYDVVNNSIALCNLEHFNIPTCSSENSCKGRCSNHTQWQTETKMRCSCDPDCYEVFNDCCSDYTKYCGAQKPSETPTKKYNYTCECVGHYVRRAAAVYCPEGDGLWMVNRCGSEWPNDTVRTKCELVPVNDTDGYLPVLGYDNTTFRNRYCAICNGVERFEPWPLDVEVDSEDKHLAKKLLRPGKNQTRRYCLNNVIDSCPRGKRFESCIDGDVALVSHREFHFKNADCATCFGLPSETFSCFTWKLNFCLHIQQTQIVDKVALIEFIPFSEVMNPVVYVYEEVKKYVPTKCNGSVVLYTTEDYTKMANWSIYVKKTSSLYDYGEYDILPNKSVTICQYFEMRILNKTRQTVRYNKPPGLGYVTFISFLLSILCLIFLLVTYLLFPQLRTLPGKNLMNFAASLLLFQVFWLPLNFTEVTSDKPACKAVAVLEHYFLTGSFVGMSVIAFHTCKVFARSLPGPKMSTGRERKLFCVYVALVWILPAVFVGICIVLDDQDVVEIGYGESEICWLSKNANTYFVTIPIGVLLLFNIIAFVTTAVYLRKNSQNIAARQVRRSNLSIFIKLSTLMGFTWLFGLLALVVTSTTVFWYFFVILTSLQGVFVTMAFVVNARTFSLYKQRYTSSGRSATTHVKPHRKYLKNNCNKTRV